MEVPPPAPETDDLVQETAASALVSQEALPGDTTAQTAVPPETAHLPEAGTLKTARAPEPAEQTPEPPCSSPNTQCPDADRRLSETQSRESLDEEVAASTDIYFVSVSMIAGH